MSLLSFLWLSSVPSGWLELAVSRGIEVPLPPLPIFWLSGSPLEGVIFWVLLLTGLLEAVPRRLLCSCSIVFCHFLPELLNTLVEGRGCESGR